MTHEEIRQEVQDLMGFSMEAFGLEQIIDCSEELTEKEKVWAKKHLGWRVVIVADRREHGQDSERRFQEG